LKSLGFYTCNIYSSFISGNDRFRNLYFIIFKDWPNTTQKFILIFIKLLLIYHKYRCGEFCPLKEVEDFIRVENMNVWSYWMCWLFTKCMFAHKFISQFQWYHNTSWTLELLSVCELHLFLFSRTVFVRFLKHFFFTLMWSNYNVKSSLKCSSWKYPVSIKPPYL